MFGLQLDPEERQLRPYCGLPVCVLMNDGSRKVGRLSGCGEGKLILNGDADDGPGEVAVSRKAAPRRNSKRARTRVRKTKERAEAEDHPEIQADTDGFALPPFGLEPLFAAMPRESIPLKNVEAVLVL